MITKERLEELHEGWNECDCWDKDDFYNWWYGLTDEEQEQIRAWDRQYEKGVMRICKDILESNKKG